MNYTYIPMLDISMPSVSILGWIILALSLASDHLDFLGWPGMDILTRKVIYYYLEPELSIYLAQWVTL